MINKFNQECLNLIEVQINEELPSHQFHFSLPNLGPLLSCQEEE